MELWCGIVGTRSCDRVWKVKEIWSGGQTPYPGLTNREVIELIFKGERLGQPERCPDTIYKIMQGEKVIELSSSLLKFCGEASPQNFRRELDNSITNEL